MEKPEKLKMTVQRRVILEEIRNAGTHPSTDELYLAVRRRLPEISIATVYRNLETLAGHGLIRRLWEVGAPRRYDGELRDHYHVVCEQCGRVDDLSLEAVDGFLDEVRRVSDYDVQGYRLGFYGLCPDCRREVPDRGPAA